MMTAEEARALWDYEPDTGILRWRRQVRIGVLAGDKAGTLHGKGSIVVRYGRKGYEAHRLIWLIVTGEWPSKLIDHKDCNRSNNRWSNLRLADYRQNQQNSKRSSRNVSGFKGAHPLQGKRKKRWASTIRVDGTLHYLGTFRTPEEAHATYVAAARQYFGEFANAG